MCRSSHKRTAFHPNGPFFTEMGRFPAETGRLFTRMSGPPPEWAIHNQNGRFAANLGRSSSRSAYFSSEPADSQLHQDISRQNGPFLATMGDSPPKWAESALSWKIFRQDGPSERKIVWRAVERSHPLAILRLATAGDFSRMSRQIR
jgi:hypothetical protein